MTMVMSTITDMSIIMEMMNTNITITTAMTTIITVMITTIIHIITIMVKL